MSGGGTTRWQQLARRGAGADYAKTYAARFRAMAERGEDIHGEAALVTALVDPPARVLDAGCGTGRIGLRLHELGYAVVGVDVDDTMLHVARAEAPEVDWREADLATFDLGQRFDLVLLAGNIVPLLEPGTLAPVAARLAAHVAPGGRVVCGFGLDAAHLPAGCPVTPLADFDDAMAAAGLEQEARFSGWDRAPFDPASGYVVAVHRPAS
ncbi:class I SAM-dependent methyltransferase [Nocardioides ungokensis]|uniref:class I SAM-dependent methyltransferase n=1 Tax=Nocardioides ungokensis TaxID=1643322 RepID=UPI001FEBD29C|nr:class I SAM-dependent methyltransferase [Nocardioides ungokensis]